MSDETPVSADSDGTPAVADDTLESVFEKLPGDVTSDQRLIFSVNMMIFSPEVHLIWVCRIWSSTQLIREVIDRPIRESLRRHPRAHLDEIYRQVDELLQNDFVEPAASPWASNIVLVKKKDGSFRMCVSIIDD